MSELKDLPFESGDMKPTVFPGDNPVIRSYVGGLSLEALDVGVAVDDILADLSGGILEANPEARFNTLLAPIRPEGIPQARPEGIPQARPEGIPQARPVPPAITTEVKREVILPTGTVAPVIISRLKPLTVPLSASRLPSVTPVLSVPQPLPPVLPAPQPVLPQPLPPVLSVPQPVVVPGPTLPQPVVVPGPTLPTPLGAVLPITATRTVTPKIVSRVTSITRLPRLTIPSSASTAPTLPPTTLPPTTLPPTTLPPTTLPPTALPPTLQGNRPVLPAVTGGRASSAGRAVPTKRIEIQSTSNVIKLPTAGGRPNLPTTVVKEEESPMATTSKGTEIMALDIEPIITPQNISSKRFELPTFSSALTQKKAVIVKKSTAQAIQTSRVEAVVPTAAMASMTISRPTTSAEQRANELGIDLSQVNMERKGSYTVPRLREIIKALGLKGYSTAHKDELVRAIREHFGL